MQPIPHAADFRPDIQGLRAIAVTLVLVFHLWPEWLPGGYVGVDVFFVISGYLITSLLYRELARSDGISLPRFYARRVRRLLPAASIVLLFTAAATLLVAPRFKWLEIAHDIAASTLYLQNWRLAANAVDYLAAEEAVGPLKHFWSLAIEEQYYIVWPALLLVLAWSARRAGATARPLLAAAALAILVVSLWFSVTLTVDDPATAYFASHTRVWELAIGSLLALLPRRAGGTAAHGAIGIAGLAMVVASAALYTKSTPFPGYTALLPTVGTALAIWAGGRGALHEPVLSTRPMLFLGDISYSLYLWHWPLIVFAGYLLPDGHGLVGGLVLLVLSIALATWSKRYVEDRFRGPPHGVVPPGAEMPVYRGWQPGAVRLATVCMASTLVAAIGITLWVQTRSVRADDARLAVDNPGAAALFAGAVARPDAPLVPALEAARGDLAAAYNNGCHARPRHLVPRGCDLAAPQGRPVVVLVGDSHAANWIPTLEVLGRERGWRVVSYTKSACALTLEDPSLGGKPYSECTIWSRAVLDELATLRPDAIVLGRSRAGGRLHGFEDREREGEAPLVAMLQRLFAELKRTGAKVHVLRDTPRMPFDPPACLSGDGPCAAPRASAMAGFDPLVAAAAGDPDVAVIDMTDGICLQDACPAVVGNVLVWRDDHHLTATYARTLAPLLGERLGLAAGAPVPDLVVQGDPVDLPFAYRLRHDRMSTTGIDRRAQRRVLMEVAGGDPAGIVESMRTTLVAAGWQATPARPSRGGMRADFRKPGRLPVAVLVRPRGVGPVLVDPASTVSVYLTETAPKAGG